MADGDTPVQVRGLGRLSVRAHVAVIAGLGVIGVAAGGGGVVAALVTPAESFGLTVVGVTGAVALAAVVGLLAATVALRKRVQPLEAVDSALGAYAAGERDGAALALGERFGVRAAAWNAILAERQTVTDGRRRETVLASVVATRSGGGVMAQAFDALRQGIVLLDEHGLVTHVNGAAAVMLGVDRGLIVDRLFSETVTDEGVREIVGAAVSGAVPDATRELRPDDSGEGSILRFSARPMRKDDTAAAMIVIEDVTQQRLADNARSGFVAQATHELRTPLTNIRLYVEEAIEEGEEDPVLRARALQVINHESRRLERVVADMLSVSEIEAGTLTLRPGEVRLGPVFEELASDFRPQAESKSIEFVMDLPPKYPVAWADRDKLVLAIHNLVGNAIKYTPEGGRVEVIVEADEQDLTVHVKDSGIGIGEEDQKRIFDRFYRANDGRIAEITGTGLGLSLARDVVRLHGGDITLESEIDKGSTFTLRAPISRGTERAAT